MVRFSLSLVLAAIIVALAPKLYAQENQQTLACLTAVEIAFRIPDDEPDAYFWINIYNESKQTWEYEWDTDSWEPLSTFDQAMADNCIWTADLDMPNSNDHERQYTVLQGNEVYRFDFVRVIWDSAFPADTAVPDTTFSFTYYTCAVGGLYSDEIQPEERFFCNLPPNVGGDGDVIFTYDDGELHAGSSPFVTAQFGDYFGDDNWVIPYNGDILCADEDFDCDGFNQNGNPFLYRKRIFLMPQALPYITFADEADTMVPGGFAYEWTFGAPFDDVSLKFPMGTKLVIEGDLSAENVIFTESDTGQDWGGVEVQTGGTLTFEASMVKHAAVGLTVAPGATADLTDTEFWHSAEGIRTEGALTLTGGVAEGASGGAAVAVYDGGTAVISGAELRDSKVGLLVASDAGVAISGSVVRNNDTGIRADVVQAPGGPLFCRGGCPRSDLDVFDSFVYDNYGNGLSAYFANVEVTGTEIRDNGGYGVYASSSLIEDFRQNLVVENGANGTWAGTGADLFLSPVDETGENRIASNDGSEVVILQGGFSFLGDATGLTGDNAVFDPTPPPGRSPFLVRNYSETLVEANFVYWGSENGPPPGTIQEPVDTRLALPCDPTPFPLSPDDPRPCAIEAGPGGGGRSQALAQTIQATRQALASGPGAAGADSLVYRLGGLHRFDAGDASGEWGQTAVLLASLRGTLSQAGLSAAERAAAEAALQVEAVQALAAGEVMAAADLLLAWRGHVVSAEVVQVLRLVEAALRSRVGQYAQAAAVAQTAAAALPAGEARAGIEALAAHYAERAAETGAGARGVDPAQAGLLGEPVLAGAAARASGRAEARLDVYPNPAAGVATVVLTTGAASAASVAVFDVLGRRVAVLHEGPLTTGPHALSLDAARLPAGVYLVRATAGGAALVQRLTVVR